MLKIHFTTWSKNNQLFFCQECHAGLWEWFIYFHHDKNKFFFMVNAFPPSEYRGAIQSSNIPFLKFYEIVSTLIKRKMVGEHDPEQPQRSTQYLYREDSYELLARDDRHGDSSEVYWYHSELNGLPERMTDAQGKPPICASATAGSARRTATTGASASIRCWRRTKPPAAPVSPA